MKCLLVVFLLAGNPTYYCEECALIKGSQKITSLLTCYDEKTNKIIDRINVGDAPFEITQVEDQKCLMVNK